MMISSGNGSACKCDKPLSEAVYDDPICWCLCESPGPIVLIRRVITMAQFKHGPPWWTMNGRQFQALVSPVHYRPCITTLYSLLDSQCRRYRHFPFLPFRPFWMDPRRRCASPDVLFTVIGNKRLLAHQSAATVRYELSNKSLCCRLPAVQYRRQRVQACYG